MIICRSDLSGSWQRQFLMTSLSNQNYAFDLVQIIPDVISLVFRSNTKCVQLRRWALNQSDSSLCTLCNGGSPCQIFGNYFVGKCVDVKLLLISHVVVGINCEINCPTDVVNKIWLVSWCDLTINVG